MLKKQSKWKIVAEIGMPDNGQLSADQEHVESKYMDLLSDEERRAGVRLPDDVLASILQAHDANLQTPEGQQQALDIVMNYRKNPQLQQQSQMGTEPMETAVPAIENPVNQESMMGGDDVLNIDSTVPPNAPLPGQKNAKYTGEHKKKKKKGDKRHLKGKGPKADKANEIYHAIMRDRDGKGEPTKDEQASAAAIAWSQAKKTMKKKAYFRGEEARVIDSYRGMWGEELVRVSVNGQTIDIPRESLEIVSTEVIDPVQQLKEFISHIPEEVETRSQIQANIQNLKTAQEIAYRLVVEGSADLSGEELAIDAIHTACTHRIEDLEERLASSMTEADTDYIETLPQYEIGKNISASSFSRENDGWLDDIIEKQAAEAAEIDVDKLANEDPIVLVASLSPEIMANAAAVRSIAIERVEKAASPLDEETKNMIVSAYIEKTEVARRRALANMKHDIEEEVQEKQKNASLIPDEGLFL